MNTSTQKFRIAISIAAVLALSAAPFTQSLRAASPEETPTNASSMPGHSMAGHDASADGSKQMPGMTGHDGHAMKGMEGMHGSHMTGMDGMHGSHMMGAPLGQDAFGAIQEVVRKLDADPKTDWSKVDLEGLRQHLIDMNEVTLTANAAAKPIDGGLQIAVTGGGRTLDAIRRMVPAHAQEINGVNGWSARTEPIPSGVLLVVTANDAKEVQRIRGLGFIGILVSGSHHQPHHLAIAKGASPHAH